MQDEAPRERLRRSEATAYARRRLGQSVKANTLRAWPIPYKQIGRDAVYEIADLDKFIDARLAAAPARRAPAPRSLSPIDEGRIDWWIRSRLTDWRGGTCWVCRKNFRPGEKTTAIANCDGAETRFHQPCYSKWRTEQEVAARKALGLA
jgi:hypothetical protein